MDMKKFDLIALGELLIDFTENGLSAQGNPLLEVNPGGAPCNVLAMLKKLGRHCAFIGKVGDDMFGRLLRDEIIKAGICADYLLADPSVHTTLAFVKTMDNGDRDFSFYRDPGADMMLREAELPLEALRDTAIFHFGTLSMTHPEVRQATRTAVETAKAAGALISFDPNLRLPLWSDPEEARTQIAWGLGQCDILKIADNEVQFMTGAERISDGVEALRERYPNILLLNATLGAEGSEAWFDSHHVYEPACRLGGVIETTGAGDTFCACVLNTVLEHGLERMTEDDLRAMLRFANTAAYLVTTKRGAIRSMPDRTQVEAILSEK